MSDSNKNLHEIRFLPPCGREDPANALRRSPYDGIGSFLLLFFPHLNKLLFVLKDIGADTAARCFMRAGRVDIQSFLESMERKLSSMVRQAEHRQKDSGPA